MYMVYWEIKIYNNKKWCLLKLESNIKRKKYFLFANRINLITWTKYKIFEFQFSCVYNIEMCFFMIE